MTAAERYGRRKITGMRAEWNALREAVRSGDPERTERAFDACEEWIDFAFGRGPKGVQLQTVGSDE